MLKCSDTVYTYKNWRLRDFFKLKYLICLSYVLKLISGTWSGKTYRSWSSDTSLNHLDDAPIENVINGCNEIHILVVEINAEVDGDDHVYQY